MKKTIYDGAASPNHGISSRRHRFPQYTVERWSVQIDGWSHTYGPFFEYDWGKALNIAKEIGKDAATAVAVLEWSAIDRYKVVWESNDELPTRSDDQ